MKLTQLAAQLYTCRDTLKNTAGLSRTLRRLREIGYTAVQLSGLGPIPYPEVARILADTGMLCCVTHEPSQDILSAPEKIIDRLRILDCKITAYPFPKDIDFSSSRAVDRFIAQLEHAAQTLAQAGQTLCYHNHNHEFRKLNNIPILDLIYTGAPALHAELDTYWVQYGGGDILTWCRKLNSRLTVMHLKDYQTTSANQPLWSEIGNGNLDFKTIIPAAETSGCQWFIVEQDTCPGDPIDSLAISCRYIQQNLIS